MPITALLPSNDQTLVSMADIADPEPAADEAVVAVEAFSPNRGEILLLAEGTTQPPGKDIAGHVVQAAADGSGPGVGARVVTHLEGGGWAERVAVPARQLVALPDGVTSELAAALPLAGLTALRLLRAAGGIAGKTVLLTGASGGVGHYLVELAAATGARVTAVTRTQARGARLLALGAERIVTSVEDADGPFDVVLESVGGETFGLALLKLRPGGLLVWFGQASQQPATADFFALMRGPVDVELRSAFYWTEAEADADDLATLVRLVAAGRLHPEIGETAAWTDTQRVLAALRDREVRGNAVLTLPAQAGNGRGPGPESPGR